MLASHLRPSLWGRLLPSVPSLLRVAEVLLASLLQSPPLPRRLSPDSPGSLTDLLLGRIPPSLPSFPPWSLPPPPRPAVHSPLGLQRMAVWPETCRGPRAAAAAKTAGTLSASVLTARSGQISEHSGEFSALLFFLLGTDLPFSSPLQKPVW